MSSGLKLMPVTVDLNQYHTVFVSVALGTLSSSVRAATISQGVAVSQTFQVLYKNEDLLLNDAFTFTVQMLLDSNKVMLCTFICCVYHIREDITHMYTRGISEIYKISICEITDEFV